jgi:hypothetical protein
VSATIPGDRENAGAIRAEGGEPYRALVASGEVERSTRAVSAPDVGTKVKRIDGEDAGAVGAKTSGPSIQGERSSLAVGAPDVDDFIG